jgi:predicted TPR repeat methyltransferase
MEPESRHYAAIAEEYDRGAEDTGWWAPEVAFGLAYRHVRPGQTVLDLGIGTGLGSILFHKAGLQVYGMDVSEEMIAACRHKGFAAELKQHDLTSVPYPYDHESVDHVVCVGVLNFFQDLGIVFQEVSRMLRDRGIFAFAVADRGPGEAVAVLVGPEHTGSDSGVTFYRHDRKQISDWLGASDMSLDRDLRFSVYLDSSRSSPVAIRVYLARRDRRSQS